ncbi:16137_t:CDS:2, partial [Racocetra persica]
SQQPNESDSHHKGHRSQSSRSSISSFLAQQRQQSGMSSITPRDTRSHSRSHSKQKSISGSTTINATGSAGSTGSDDEVSECQHAGCLIKFNWWNRRHHCRRTGNIFCSATSAFSMLLFPDGSEDWGGVWSR